MCQLIKPHLITKLTPETSKEESLERRKKRNKEIKEVALKAKWGVLNAEIDTAIQEAVDDELCKVHVVESAVSRKRPPEKAGINRKCPPEKLGASSDTLETPHPQTDTIMEDIAAKATAATADGNIELAQEYDSLAKDMREAAKRDAKPSGQLLSPEELLRTTEETEEGKIETTEV